MVVYRITYCRVCSLRTVWNFYYPTRGFFYQCRFLPFWYTVLELAITISFVVIWVACYWIMMFRFEVSCE